MKNMHEGFRPGAAADVRATTILMVSRRTAVVCLPFAAARLRAGEPGFSLRGGDADALLGRMNARGWWETASLLQAFGGDGGAKVLAHDFGPQASAPEYAYLLLGDGRAVRRALVALKQAGNSVLLLFDLMSGSAATDPHWDLDYAGSALRPLTVRPAAEDLATQLSPGGMRLASRRRRDDAVFLNLFAARACETARVDSIEAVGVRLGEWVVVFYADVMPARSAFSFFLDGPERMKFLVTGMAPGPWDVWWNGSLELPQALVEPRRWTLCFPGAGGSYFFRKL